MRNKLFRTFTVTLLAGIFPLLLSAQNIYWIESSFNNPRLVKSAPDGTELLSVSLSPGSLPQSIVLNEDNRNLIWTELLFNNAHINRIPASLNSPSVILDSQSALRAIAIDQQNNMVYWSSTNLVEGPKIWRSEINSISPEILINFAPGSKDIPRSIGLDTINEKIYWTNFGEGLIQRANMSDGTDLESLLTDLGGPSGLAVDAQSNKIYWTEMNSNLIKSADLEGNNETLLISGLSAPNSISIDSRINLMAWTELGSGKIKSAALDGSGISDYGIEAITPAGILIEPQTEISGDLYIVPADTNIQVHNFVQFQALFVDSFNMAHSTDAYWYVKEDHLGPISTSGQLFAYFPGKAQIMAKVDTFVAKSKLTVSDTIADNDDVNKIKITRIFPNQHQKKPKVFKEGVPFTLGGLPHPYNVLNGTKIYIPFGSLTEDITLEIDLPGLCTIHKDSVEFDNEIINAVQFNVFVGDSLVDPFYFKRPVSIALPFKRGLLKKYGINPEHLGLFYVPDSTTLDTLGISQVMVDSSANRIFALIEHFSTLAVREKTVLTTSATEQEPVLAEKYILYQNYPNPFNPLTYVSYSLPVDSDVELNIYNILGQKVTTLVNTRQKAGFHQVSWDAKDFASGLYFCILETAKGFSQSRKLILLK